MAVLPFHSLKTCRESSSDAEEVAMEEVKTSEERGVLVALPRAEEVRGCRKEKCQDRGKVVYWSK